MGNRGRTHVRHGESLASTIDLAFRIIQQDPADPLAENRPPEILELFREWWKLRTQSRNAWYLIHETVLCHLHPQVRLHSTTVLSVSRSLVRLGLGCCQLRSFYECLIKIYSGNLFAYRIFVLRKIGDLHVNSYTSIILMTQWLFACVLLKLVTLICRVFFICVRFVRETENFAAYKEDDRN